MLYICVLDYIWIGFWIRINNINILFNIDIC